MRQRVRSDTLSSPSSPVRTTIILRCINNHFVVIGRDIAPAKFESRREAKDWCVTITQARPSTRSGRIPSARAMPTGRCPGRSYAQPKIEHPAAGGVRPVP